MSRVDDLARRAAQPRVPGARRGLLSRRRAIGVISGTVAGLASGALLPELAAADQVCCDGTATCPQGTTCCCGPGNQGYRDCCTDGLTCFPEGTGQGYPTCCSTICNGQCCDVGQTCSATLGCQSDCANACGDLCCDTGETCCGDTCCYAGAECLSPGVCATPCPSGQSRCGSACCDTSTQTCVDGTCQTLCDDGRPKCGTTCCPPDHTCVNGVCSPCSTHQTACASSCCDAGTSCCEGRICCPDGWGCFDQDGKGGNYVCCDYKREGHSSICPLDNRDAASSVCCPAGTTCATIGTEAGLVVDSHHQVCCPPERLVTAFAHGSVCCPEGFVHTPKNDLLVGSGLCCRADRVCGDTCCPVSKVLPQDCCAGQCYFTEIATCSGGVVKPKDQGVAKVRSESVSSRGDAEVHVTCSGPGSCSGTVQLVSAPASTRAAGAAAAAQVLGEARFKVAARRNGTVRVRLGRRALRSLNKHGHLRVQAVVVRKTPSGGVDRLPSKAFTLRKPKGGKRA